MLLLELRADDANDADEADDAGDAGTKDDFGTRSEETNDLDSDTTLCYYLTRC